MKVYLILNILLLTDTVNIYRPKKYVKNKVFRFSNSFCNQ
ncbi:hypothetical protein P689_122188 [Candidatus Riesia pediculischaeffi PTSU]|uniref:Uncharacterized protein n=1 Tax=Candidatus Riesia pediculischaeffi PTSU TaxID=1401651 RepID=A0A0C1V6E8_9ENTR|nr:hypothetical protein P689_122188 [Candidatus Riesia pediculischaeffi PTSU]